MMYKLSVLAVALAFASTFALAGEMQRLNGKGEKWVCTEQDSHCIYVNGIVGNYYVTYKSGGKDSSDLVCDDSLGITMTDPCKVTTAHGPVTVNVACRISSFPPRDVIGVAPRNVDITFIDDTHANLTTHDSSTGKKMWAGFVGSPNKKLTNGAYAFEAPHISAIVNCISDNPDGE